MRKLRLYLDSSVIGWSLNRGLPSRYAEANLLLHQIAEKKFIGAYSQAVVEEMEAAPPPIRKKLWNKVTAAGLRMVSSRYQRMGEESAQRYCAEKIVPPDCFADALHIALATLWKADALVSYNFEHIVSLDTMLAVNAANKALNLREIFLCQPQEVIRDENKS